MAERRNRVIIEDTRFIWYTNFSGDPDRDRNYHSSTRKTWIVIPDEEMAKRLADEGFNIKVTEPGPDDDPKKFVSEYFVGIIANYDSAFPPRIKLVVGDNPPVLLDADTVSEIDRLYDNGCVKNVNAVLNPYYNQKRGTRSLYINTMYVEQDLEADPFASRYAKG